jgi:hypothetical protein
LAETKRSGSRISQMRAVAHEKRGERSMLTAKAS